MREVNELSGEIVKILPDVALCRFGIKDGRFDYNEYGLFYLVEGPDEKAPRDRLFSDKQEDKIEKN